MKDSNTHPTVAASKSKGNSITKIPSNCCLPLITADQYASRSAMLHSLAVAWSPVLRLSSKKYPVPQNGSSNWFSILAVGGRSGKVSLWRICVPKCYSVEDCKVPTTAVLIGVFQAHNSWITSISLAVLSSDSSNPQVLLVTGSSDGRWVMHSSIFSFAFKLFSTIEGFICKWLPELLVTAPLCVLLNSLDMQDNICQT